MSHLSILNVLHFILIYHLLYIIYIIFIFLFYFYSTFYSLFYILYLYSFDSSRVFYPHLFIQFAFDNVNLRKTSQSKELVRNHYRYKPKVYYAIHSYKLLEDRGIFNRPYFLHLISLCSSFGSQRAPTLKNLKRR